MSEKWLTMWWKSCIVLAQSKVCGFFMVLTEIRQEDFPNKQTTSVFQRQNDKSLKMLDWVVLFSFSLKQFVVLTVQTLSVCMLQLSDTWWHHLLMYSEGFRCSPPPTGCEHAGLWDRWPPYYHHLQGKMRETSATEDVVGMFTVNNM